MKNALAPLFDPIGQYSPGLIDGYSIQILFDPNNRGT